MALGWTWSHNLAKLLSSVVIVHNIDLPAEMYSALAVDSATKFCFFDDQDTSDLPSNWHVLHVLFLSTLHPA